MGQLTMDDITEMIKLISATYPYAFKEISNPSDIKRVKELWYALLSDYPKKLIVKAFHNCMKTEKVNIVPANIIEQIEKIQSAFEPSEQELWREFVLALSRAQRYIDRLYYTAVEENGKTQGENAREGLNAVYGSLKPEFQRYCGGVSGLMALASLDDESLEFERARFLKSFRRIQEQVRTQQEFPALAGMVEMKLLEEKS